MVRCRDLDTVTYAGEVGSATASPVATGLGSDAGEFDLDRLLALGDSV